MKLLNCKNCHDILQLSLRVGKRRCLCKKSGARYIDDDWVVYYGPARILGIGWEEYRASMILHPTLDNDGLVRERFQWFEIPEGRHIKKMDREAYDLLK